MWRCAFGIFNLCSIEGKLKDPNDKRSMWKLFIAWSCNLGKSNPLEGLQIFKVYFPCSCRFWARGLENVAYIVRKIYHYRVGFWGGWTGSGDSIVWRGEAGVVGGLDSDPSWVCGVFSGRAAWFVVWCSAAWRVGRGYVRSDFFLRFCVVSLFRELCRSGPLT